MSANCMIGGIDCLSEAHAPLRPVFSSKRTSCPCHRHPSSVRVARHSAGTRFFDERLGDYALVELVQNPISRLLHVCSVLNAENETARNRCNIWPLRAYSL
jgi:hypothetical protein